MSQPASNALLPPMEADEFKATFSYCLLMEHGEYQREACAFLNVISVDNLAFVANPYYGFYTQYEQEDFDEVLAYVQQYRKAAERNQQLYHTLTEFAQFFVLAETSVGGFILCKHVNAGILGILSA